MKTQTGFTLIELIIVMVIVGLLAAVASPKFFDFQSTARTNSSTPTGRMATRYSSRLISLGTPTITLLDASRGQQGRGGI